jgi:hypothetical protein
MSSRKKSSICRSSSFESLLPVAIIPPLSIICHSADGYYSCFSISRDMHLNLWSDLRSVSLRSTRYLLLSSGDLQVLLSKFLRDGIEQIMHVPLPILSYTTICYQYPKGAIYIIEIAGVKTQTRNRKHGPFGRQGMCCWRTSTKEQTAHHYFI